MTTASPDRPELTAKGRRHTEQIIAAATVCLARDGYAVTSLQRIADEAGLSKATVLYYFSSREELIDRVSRAIGDHLVAQVEAAISPAERSGHPLTDSIERIWDAASSDRSLQAAWLGTHAESLSSPALQATVALVAAQIRASLGQLIDTLVDGGWRLTVPRAGLEVLLVSLLQGLLMEIVERGATSELDAALIHLRSWTDRALESPAG